MNQAQDNPHDAARTPDKHEDKTREETLNQLVDQFADDQPRETGKQLLHRHARDTLISLAASIIPTAIFYYGFKYKLTSSLFFGVLIGMFGYSLYKTFFIELPRIRAKEDAEREKAENEKAAAQNEPDEENVPVSSTSAHPHIESQENQESQETPDTPETPLAKEGQP